MGSRIIPHLAQIVQVLYNRLKECGALPFFGTCHGQPRRRHRRGTDRLDPGAWHYETEYRHTDPLQHGNRLLRFSGGWNALTPMSSMGLPSSTRSSPTLNFAAPTRADLPRWLPSALASMWWPPSFTLGDMPGEPGISPDGGAVPAKMPLRVCGGYCPECVDQISVLEVLRPEDLLSREPSLARARPLTSRHFQRSRSTC